MALGVKLISNGDFPAPASPVLGLQVYATTAGVSDGTFYIFTWLCLCSAIWSSTLEESIRVI